MRIHERHRLNVPSLLDVDRAIRNAAFHGSPDWLIFAVVRNPFSRAVSTFENKIRLGEPGYTHFERRYGDHGPFDSIAGAFRAYVEEVIGNSEEPRTDMHLWPQSDLLMPGLIAYSRIFRLERIEELYLALRAHLQPSGASIPPLLEHRNASLSVADWRSYYDDISAATIARVYDEDFKLFGYDCAAWKPLNGEAGPPREPDLIRRWRAEVVERNAVINEFYEELFSASKAEKAIVREDNLPAAPDSAATTG
jgi:hypothetical protein